MDKQAALTNGFVRGVAQKKSNNKMKVIKQKNLIFAPRQN